MRVNSMRWLDRWVGAPGSTTLTVMRHMRDRLSSGVDDDPKKILFIKLVEQGATVIAEPAEPKYIRLDEGELHTLESNGLKLKEGVYY